MKLLIFMVIFVVMAISGLYAYSTTIAPEIRMIEVEARGENG